MTDSHSSLYPIAVLIDELRSEDQKKRIHSINKISTICVALGPERTRNELLPYILELLEDDEEVLSALAQVLGTLLEFVGGAAQADHLLKVLERLCATESIKSILSAIRLKDYEQSIMAMIQRLMNAENNCPRFCVIQLIPSVYTTFVQSNQSELIEIFNKIILDPAPQIRKLSAQVLIEMINLIPKASETDLLNIFQSINQDEQDSVRMHSVDCLVAFTQHLSKAKVSVLVPIVKKLAEDKSWRIRCIVAQQIVELAKGMTADQTKDVLLPCYSAFLSDSEGEVRVAAVSKVTDFCKLLEAESIVTKVVPYFAELQKDQYQFVRAALAESILTLCPQIGKANTTQHILPVFLLLLRDDNSEVRLNLFKRLDDLNSVIGIDELSTSLIPSLEELAKEKNWRMKIQVIEKFPMLARQLGENFFNEKLNLICIGWLKDQVFSVREATLAMFKQLAKLFGDAWVLKYYYPSLIALQSDTSYLNRLTVQFGIVQLADAVSSEMVKTKFVPVLAIMAKDPVANVRLNVAKSLQAMKGQIKASKECVEQTKQLLKSLQQDKDTDVAFFTQKALKMFI